MHERTFSLRRIFAAAILACWAPAVTAQTMCPDLAALTTDAHKGFTDIKGQATDVAAGNFATTKALPGAGTCWLHQELSDFTYWCRWAMPAPQLPAAYRQLADAVKTCFPSAEASIDQPDNRAAAAIIRPAGARFFISIDYVSDVLTLSLDTD